MKLTEKDIQIRFVTHASAKIIINSNANFYLKDEKFDYSNDSIEDKRHRELKQQILEHQEFYHKFHNSEVYSFTEDEMKPFRTNVEKLEKIQKLVNSHNGSDHHARELFDEIEALLEKNHG